MSVDRHVERDDLLLTMFLSLKKCEILLSSILWCPHYWSSILISEVGSELATVREFRSVFAAYRFIHA